jgi:hypothetical protein
MIEVGCAAPAAISTLGFSLSGRQVTLTWSASPGATDYVLEAGTSSGAANVITVPTATAALTAQAPPNTYYVRVRPRNACGSGPFSNEVVIAVP